VSARSGMGGFPTLIHRAPVADEPSGLQERLSIYVVLFFVTAQVLNLSPPSECGRSCQSSWRSVHPKERPRAAPGARFFTGVATNYDFAPAAP
jgi:hypothetical protein